MLDRLKVKKRELAVEKDQERAVRQQEDTKGPNLDLDTPGNSPLVKNYWCTGQALKLCQQGAWLRSIEHVFHAQT